jgi:3-hydroxy-5-methyl-1-naphthoate 3-O-methyltransferase
VPLLDACVALKLVRHSEKGYENTLTARLFLVPGREVWFGPVLRFWQRFSYGVWGRLEEAVRSGEPQTATGPKSKDLFEQLVKDRDQVRLFFDGLAGLAYWPAQKIAETVPFDRHRHLLDVGCGSGAFSAAIARRHAHLRVTLFDLEPVCALARERFAALGLNDRVQIFAGDFHCDSLPEGADCILLSNVLHDWPAEACRVLLAKAYRALSPGGEILIYEVTSAGERPPAEVSQFGLALLLDTTQGGVYGVGELQCWLTEAGFRLTQDYPITEGTVLLRATREP